MKPKNIQNSQQDKHCSIIRLIHKLFSSLGSTAWCGVWRRPDSNKWNRCSVRTLSSRSSSLSSISSSLRLHSYSTWMWGLNFPSAACTSWHTQTHTTQLYTWKQAVVPFRSKPLLIYGKQQQNWLQIKLRDYTKPYKQDTQWRVRGEEGQQKEERRK